MLRFDKTPSNTLTGTQFIHEWVHHLKSLGYDIIDASRGKPSMAIDDKVIKAMQDKLQSSLGEVFPYGKDCLGEDEYRNIVAKSLSDFYNIKIDSSQVAFTPGGQFSLYCLFKILNQKDGVFVTTNPGYLNYNELIRYVGEESNCLDNQIFAVNLTKNDNFKLNAKTFEKSLLKNSKPINAFVFCNPVNPTGQVINCNQWLEIAKVLKKYEAPIIMDEAFIEVVFGEDKKCSLLHASPELLSRMILIRSGTKAQGFPGERLCSTILPKNLIEKFRYHQSRLLGNSPILAQVGMAKSIEYLNDDKIDNISKYYQEHAEIITNALDEIVGTKNYIKPEGGFFLLADFSKLKGLKIPQKAKDLMGIKGDYISSDTEIMASLLFGLNNNKSIAVVPASYFGVDKNKMIVRISFSIAKTELKQLIARLKDLY